MRLPRYRQEQLRALQEGRRAWRRQHGREPNTEELARATGLSYEEVDRLRTLGQNPVSIEEPTSPGGSRPLHEVLTDGSGNGPQDSLIQGDLRSHIRGLIGSLKGKERKVVLLRYGFDGHDPMTLREIGRRLGISRERVRQLERRALIQLRNAL